MCSMVNNDVECMTKNNLPHLKIDISQGVNGRLLVGDEIVQQVLIIVCRAAIQEWNTFPHKYYVTCFLQQ